MKTFELLDDTSSSIQFQGRWRTHFSIFSLAYNETLTSTSEVGSSFSYDFNGSYIEVYTDPRMEDEADVVFTLDNEQGNRVRMFPDDEPESGMLFSQSLLPGMHTLVVTNFGDSFALDYLRIHSQATISDPSGRDSTPISSTTVRTSSISTLSSTISQPLPTSISSSVVSSKAASQSSTFTISSPSGTATLSTSSQSATSVSNPAPQASDRMGVGAVVGISFVVLAALCATAAIYVFVRRRHRRAQRPRQMSNFESYPTASAENGIRKGIQKNPLNASAFSSEHVLHIRPENQEARGTPSIGSQVATVGGLDLKRPDGLFQFNNQCPYLWHCSSDVYY
ncbi:hypothetical protein C8Q74DRAFT_982129 [Fomes fomentarius]|nr:hypothetical protein C8Q74DRAFT_982129 [Fomes fomentarius]